MSELTKRGVAKNISTSPYFHIIGNVKLYFTSQFIKDKFIKNYDEYKEDIKYRAVRLFKIPVTVSDIVIIVSLYKQVEKRGFYIIYNDKPYISDSEMSEDRVI